MKKLTCSASIYVLLASACFATVPYAGDDCDNGITQVNGLVDTYTGNAAFSTRDIVVSGAVGRYGLSWQRHATSRASQADYFFGQGHNWTHSWQWEMSDSGLDTQGRAVITVREPRGWTYRFTETSPGQWQAASSVKNRLVLDGSDFVLQLFNGCDVRFARSKTAHGESFVAKEVKDIDGNIWRLTWENGQLAQITEPAGRWLKITYQLLTSPDSQTFTVISGVSASDGQKVAYEYSFPSGVNYPVLTGVQYPDGNSASYVYVSPRGGDRLLVMQADDPRAEQSIRGKVLYYRTEPEAAFGQIHEIRTVDGNAPFYTLETDAKQPGGRSYAVTLYNGSTVYRAYNPGGNLAQEIDALGFVTKTAYDAGGRGLKTSTTDAFGNITRFEYDSNGYLTKMTFPDNANKSWQRDARGRIITETNELGSTRRYTYDKQGRRTGVQYPDGSTEVLTYNKLGEVSNHQNRAGAVTANTYDMRGLLVQITNGLGSSTRFSYDGQDRITATTNARGNTTRYERDAAGHITNVTYPDGAISSMDYDHYGQMVKSVDASGAEHQVTYDGLGRRVAITNAKAEVTKAEYGAPGSATPIGRPVRLISPSGRVTTLAYDANGRIVARTMASGTTASATTRMNYDPVGRIISTTNPAGKTVQFVYDNRGHRIKTISALNHIVTYGYDAAGHKVSEVDAKGSSTYWTYDSMGRELTKTDAKGQVTRREYNSSGRLAALIDAKSNTYRFEYDLMGRLTSLVYPDGSRETTEYDTSGLRVRYTNRTGAVQTFAYDNRNREISSEWSDGSQKIVKAYDAAGRLTSEDNGVSRLTFTYDSIGRLLSETQDVSSIATEGTWDPAPRTVTYAYNADGKREILGYPDGSSIKYAYDEQGRLSGILANGTMPPIANYEYDDAGNATLMPRENGIDTEQEFDSENKTLTITERATDTQSPLSQTDYLYDDAGNRTATLNAYNSDTKSAPEETMDTYRHDETNQLIEANYAAPVHGNNVDAPASTEKFTYDANGNRIGVDENGAVTHYTVNNLNQYVKVGEFETSHDGNGNLCGIGQWLYRYDALNRLISASNGQIIAKFYYDAKNRCVARSYQKTNAISRSTITTLTLNTYDNWNLIEERGAGGVQEARYVYGRRIDEIVMLVNKYGTFYPHRDVIGNVTMLTDGNGKLVERYAYSVAGNITIRDALGTILPSSRVGNRWMFTGREWLAEIGLYDFRNRVYSPQLGRFLQTDPIRFKAGDINIYRYCYSRYLSGSDPMGLGFLDMIESAAEAVGGAITSVGESIGEAIAPYIPESGLAQMDQIVADIQATEDFMAELAGVAEEDMVLIESSAGEAMGALSSDMSALMGDLSAMANASYTAEGSLNIFGAFGIEGAGAASMTVAEFGGVVTVGFVAGYAVGTALDDAFDISGSIADWYVSNFGE